MNTKFINEAWTDLYFHLHYKHEDSLTHQNIRFLQVIEKNKFVTILMLSQFMNISHNTASEHVKRLMNKGLVKKEKSNEDKRTVYVKLTHEGKKALKRNTELDEEKLQAVLDRLTEEEQNQILKAFKILKEETAHVFSS